MLGELSMLAPSQIVPRISSQLLLLIPVPYFNLQFIPNQGIRLWRLVPQHSIQTQNLCHGTDIGTSIVFYASDVLLVLTTAVLYCSGAGTANDLWGLAPFHAQFPTSSASRSLGLMAISI